MSGVKGKSGVGNGGPGKGQGRPDLGRKHVRYCTIEEAALIDTIRETGADPEKLEKELRGGGKG